MSTGMGCDCGGSCGRAPLGMGYLQGLGQDPTLDDIDTLPADWGSGPDFSDLNLSTGTTAASSTSNPALSNALANLGAAWTKIAGNLIAPQTTVTTPGGLQVSTSAGQTANLAALLGGASALGTSSISAFLPWILIGGAGLFLVSALGKK